LEKLQLDRAMLEKKVKEEEELNHVPETEGLL